MDNRDELAERVDVARDLALRAGEFLLDLQGRVRNIRRKGAVDLVSEADLGAEKILREGLWSAFPQDSFYFEEGGGVGTDTSDWTWYVDPLDGTTNYLHASPHYAVSIGIAYRGVSVGGVIHAPSLGELFAGYSGGGVTLNGASIAISRVDELGEALIGTGFPYSRVERARELCADLEKVMVRSQGIRRFGAAALDLAYVACGRLDGFWEQGLHPWDVAAGMALIAEAGGEVSGRMGEKVSPDSCGYLIASNSTIHRQLVEALARD